MTSPLDIARSQIGTVETGGVHGNDGNVVPFWDWWDSVTGEHDQGASWCGAFVSFCFDRAGSRFTINGRPGFIYCPAGEAWFRSQGLLIDAAHAQPGDVAFFHFPGEPNEANHTGIIEAVDAAKRTVTSIDGNTSSNSLGSQSNGGGVYRRTRPWAMVWSVGHPAWVKPPAPPEDEPMRDERLITVPAPDGQGRQLVASDSTGAPLGLFPVTSSVQICASAAGEITRLLVEPTRYGDGLVLAISNLDGSPAPAGAQARIIIEHR